MYKERKTPAFQTFALMLKKNRLPKVMVLCGEEYYQIAWAKNSVISKYAPQEDRELNLEVLKFDDLDKGKELSIVLQKANSISFFVDSKIVIVEDASEKFVDNILEEEENVCDEAHIVILPKSISVKTLAKNQVFSFEHLSSPDLKKFITKKISEFNVEVDNVIINQVLQQCGYDTSNSFNRNVEYDLYSLNNDIQKIYYHSDSKTITRGDVVAGLSTTLQSNIYALLDMVVSGNKEKAFSMLGDIAMMGHDSTEILGKLIRQLETMAVVRELRDQGSSIGDIIRLTGEKKFLVEKAANFSKNYSLEEILRVLQKAYETDYDFKRGIIDKDLALEILIAQI